MHEAVRLRNEEIINDKKSMKQKVGRACGGSHTLQCKPTEEQGDAISRGRTLAAKGRQSPTKRPFVSLRPQTGHK